MTITKLALGTLTALCLSLAGGCDDAKKDAAKDGKTDAKGAEAKAGDVKAAEAKAADAKAAEAKAEAGAPEAKAEAGAPEAKAEAGAPEAAAGADATAKIGVAECDEYISKMSACIASGGIPKEQLDAQKMGLEMYQKSWADAIESNPAEGPALVPGCKAAIEMGKVSHPSCFESK